MFTFGRALSFAHLAGIVLGCALAVVACRGGTSTSPSDCCPGDDDPRNGPNVIYNTDRTIPPGEQFSLGFGNESFLRAGRLTLTVRYEPAATPVHVQFFRNEAVAGSGCSIPPRFSGSTLLGDAGSGSSPRELVIDPLPGLFVPNATSSFPRYCLAVWNQGTVAIDSVVVVDLVPDPNAPGLPTVEGAWDLTAIFQGPTCSGNQFAGPFVFDLGQYGTVLQVSIRDTDARLVGQLELDGAFEVTGELTPLLGENNERRGVTRTVTFTGRVTGNSMSGTISERFPGGCESTSTFSGTKRP